MTLRELFWMATGKSELLGGMSGSPRVNDKIPYDPNIIKQLAGKF